MKIYETPEVNVLNFSVEDVIVTSFDLGPDQLPIA